MILKPIIELTAIFIGEKPKIISFYSLKIRKKHN